MEKTDEASFRFMYQTMNDNDLSFVTNLSETITEQVFLNLVESYTNAKDSVSYIDLVDDKFDEGIEIEDNIESYFNNFISDLEIELWKVMGLTEEFKKKNDLSREETSERLEKLVTRVIDELVVSIESLEEELQSIQPSQHLSDAFLSNSLERLDSFKTALSTFRDRYIEAVNNFSN